VHSPGEHRLRPQRDPFWCHRDHFARESAARAITDNETSIDGGNRWQGGWPSGEPGIVINGSNPSAGGIGVQFSSAGQCRVRGVRITNFSTALHIDSGSDQAVIGVDHSMTQPVVAPMQIYRLLQ